MAKLHAAALVMSQKDPLKYNELQTLPQNILYDGEESPLLEGQKASLETALRVVEQAHESPLKLQAVEELNELKTNCVSRVKQLVLTKRKFSVMNHGDLWVSNILFNKHGDDVKFVDLQSIRYVDIQSSKSLTQQCFRFNSVALDLNHMLYVNLEPKMRDENRTPLIQKYLDNLHKFAKTKGVDLHEKLTTKWLDEEMDAFSVYGIVYGLWVMPVYYINFGNPVETSLDAMDRPEYYGRPYKERIRETVYHYIKHLNY